MQREIPRRAKGSTILLLLGCQLYFHPTSQCFTETTRLQQWTKGGLAMPLSSTTISRLSKSSGTKECSDRHLLLLVGLNCVKAWLQDLTPSMWMLGSTGLNREKYFRDHSVSCGAGSPTVVQNIQPLNGNILWWSTSASLISVSGLQHAASLP